MKLGFSRQISEEKKRNIKFHENPSSVNRGVPCETDRRDEADSRFSQLCERV